MLSFRIKEIAMPGEQTIKSSELNKMIITIQEMKAFLDTHEKFVVEMRDMLKSYMRQRDSYVYSNTYLTEFIEKYEQINLQGYNNGGYAYKESKELVFDPQQQQNEEEKDKDKDQSQSQVVMPIHEKGITIDSQHRVSMIDKLRSAIGMKLK